MSIIGGPVSASAAGAPESKRHINKAKEKRRNDEAIERRRFEDSLELHVSQVESTEAVEPLKEHLSDDAESEGHANPQLPFQYPYSSQGLSYGPVPKPPVTDSNDEEIVNKVKEPDKIDDRDTENHSIDITG